MSIIPPATPKFRFDLRSDILAPPSAPVLQAITEAAGRPGEFGWRQDPIEQELERRVTDPTVQHLAALCDQEIVEGGAAGRPYVEGLATALVVHLFRSYGVNPHKSPRVIGGLTPLQLRRVMDYIEARLDLDLGLAELAALADLSTHHFGQAFKASTGTPPHRYLIERRIHRAKELLIGGNQSIAEIAVSVGFSSQSHMTFNFRKLVATTPARYRRAMTITTISDGGEEG